MCVIQGEVGRANFSQELRDGVWEVQGAYVRASTPTCDHSNQGHTCVEASSLLLSVV